MIEQIDYARRLSPEEHYCLYLYYSSNTERVNYQNFKITEELIDHYNHASVFEKQTIAMKIREDPNYPHFLDLFHKQPWKFEKPVLWADREKTPYFIEQLTASHAFEVYIDYLFKQYGVDIGLYYGKEQQYHKGETAAGIEIKFDKKSMETGNYYIEYQERMHSKSVWVDSCILKRDDTKFYLCGTINKFMIFERAWLMNYYHRLVENRKQLPDARLVYEREKQTSKGFILLPAASRQGNIPIEKLIEEFRTNPYLRLR